MIQEEMVHVTPDGRIAGHVYKLPRCTPSVSESTLGAPRCKAAGKLGCPNLHMIRREMSMISLGSRVGERGYVFMNALQLMYLRDATCRVSMIQASKQLGSKAVG